MSKESKKSRKKVHNYNFINQNGEQVQVDLNNYVARCTVTGNEKGFYHSYLANLIDTKYDGNIDVFEQNYVSREGKAGDVAARKAEAIQVRIEKMYDKIKELKEGKSK